MLWNLLLPNKRQKLRLLIKFETLHKNDVFKEEAMKVTNIQPPRTKNRNGSQKFLFLN